MTSLAVLEGGRLASGSTDRTTKIWELATGVCIAALEGHNDWVLANKYSPEGDLLASACHSGNLILWDPAKAKWVDTTRAHSGACFAIAFNPQGREMATGGDDMQVLIWDYEQSPMLREAAMAGHQGNVRYVCWSDDGKWIGSASYDSTQSPPS